MTSNFPDLRGVQVPRATLSALHDVEEAGVDVTLSDDVEPRRRLLLPQKTSIN